ncbi:MAG TPA: hypothetical protein VKD69_06330, partial [Vicinamibacterales bacterium]|nr:hypothetical protein [Vicinamibacterales bacterium]
DRQVWDFPLVNVASAIKPNGGNIGEVRLVVNAVAATPKRLKQVEACRRRQAAERGDREGGRGDGRAGRRDAAPQRLQGAADAEPGDSRASGAVGCAADHITRSVQSGIWNLEFGMRCER